MKSKPSRPVMLDLTLSVESSFYNGCQIRRHRNQKLELISPPKLALRRVTDQVEDFVVDAAKAAKQAIVLIVTGGAIPTYLRDGVFFRLCRLQIEHKISRVIRTDEKGNRMAIPLHKLKDPCLNFRPRHKPHPSHARICG